MKGGTRPQGHYMRHKIQYTGCPKTYLPQEMFILRFKMWNPFKIQFKPIAKKMLTHLCTSDLSYDSIQIPKDTDSQC